MRQIYDVIDLNSVYMFRDKIHIHYNMYDYLDDTDT